MAKSAKKAAAPKKAASKKTPKTASTETNETVADAPVAKSGIVVRKDVPLPPRSRGGSTASVYPFATMEVGDSFEINTDIDADLYTSQDEADLANLDAIKTISNRLSGAARRFCKTHEGYKFAVRNTPQGVGVWRVDAE